MTSERAEVVNLTLRMPKRLKAKLQDASRLTHQNLNEYVIEAIERRMKDEAGARDLDRGITVSLSRRATEALERLAELEGESLGDFARAVLSRESRRAGQVINGVTIPAPLSISVRGEGLTLELESTEEEGGEGFLKSLERMAKDLAAKISSTSSISGVSGIRQEADSGSHSDAGDAGNSGDDEEITLEQKKIHYRRFVVNLPADDLQCIVQAAQAEYAAQLDRVQAVRGSRGEPS